MAEEEVKEELMSPAPIQIKVKPLDLGSLFKCKGTDMEIPNILSKFKLLAVFFGASWCAITKTFVPILKQFYDEINLEQKELEIIYVGMEKRQDDLNNFAKDMPWLAVPYNDPRLRDVREFYKIRTIPQVVILKSNGNVLEFNGRQDIQEQGEEVFAKWLQMKSISDNLIEKPGNEAEKPQQKPN